MTRVRNLAGKLWEKTVNRTWYSRDYISNDIPIIIGGCARSGTTLMMEMVNSHPNIYCAMESGLLYQKTITSSKMRKLSKKFEIPFVELIELRRESFSHFQFIERFFNLLRERDGKDRWGEKSPMNVLHIERIFHHFPNSKFIHVIRDGRDTACSLKIFPKYRIVNGKRYERDTLNPLDQCIMRWVRDVSAGISWREDPRYLEVKYENLIVNTENTLREVFKLLNEPWEDQVLEYYKKRDSRRKSRIVQNPGVNTPIYTTSFNRWKKEFNEDDEILFKELAGDLLIKLGYEENNDW
jgi:hypothetical protein